MPDGILDQVRQTAQGRLLFLPHAIRQMSHPDRMITPAEVKKVAITGDLVEDYPDDVRGHSCLLLGFGEEGRAIHVVCTPKPSYLAIITAYLPDPEKWSSDFTKRS